MSTVGMLLGSRLALVLGLLCDPLQIVLKHGPEVFYVAYSSVRIVDAHGNALFEGVTDKYGRVRIDLPSGVYRAEVSYRDKIWAFEITLDGAQQLRTVDLQ